MRLRRKKKEHGPFRANRILDTSEVKIDQVYTKDEKPVALFVTITEDEAKKIGAEGYLGPTNFGARGKYEQGKTWVTRAFYFMPNAQFSEALGKQIRNSVAVGGTVVPNNIQFQKPEPEKKYPISESASLRVVDNMHVLMDGKIALSPPSQPTFLRRLCPFCKAEIDVAYKECPHCGKEV